MLFIVHKSSRSYLQISDFGQRFAIDGTLGNGDPATLNEEGEVKRFYETLGITMPFSRHRPEDDFTWEQVVPFVRKWALAVVGRFREYEATPDLWAEYERSRQLFSAPSGNTPFTEPERERISMQIREIKVYITNTYELTGNQLSEVNERLDQIAEASRRLGRKDWLMAFSGAVFSLILSDLIPPQAAQHILMLALQGLGHLFGLGGPPAPLP